MYSVREITPEELPAALDLLSILLRSQRATDELYLADWKEIEDFQRGYAEGTHRCFGVFLGDTLVASGWLAGDYLTEGCVVPEHRGQNLQQRLIRIRMEHGGRHACARKTNLPSNRNFEQLGWVRSQHSRENYNTWTYAHDPERP